MNTYQNYPASLEIAGIVERLKINKNGMFFVLLNFTQDEQVMFHFFVNIKNIQLIERIRLKWYQTVPLCTLIFF